MEISRQLAVVAAFLPEKNLPRVYKHRHGMAQTLRFNGSGRAAQYAVC